MKCTTSFLLQVSSLALCAVLTASTGCRKRSKPEAAPADSPASTTKPPAATEGATPPPAAAKMPPPASAAALQSVDLTPVREAIAKYEQQFKQKPFGLPDLVRSGLLKELPKVPPGGRINYDREKATVTMEAIQ